MDTGGALMQTQQANVRCDKYACHGNSKGLCSVLAQKITGKECPFYKSKLRLFMERAALKSGDYKAYLKARHIK